MNEELNIISRCKFCQTPLEARFIDIILLPQHHDQSKGESHAQLESGYLLPTFVCSSCFLVQVDESYLPATQERVYVSSFASSWLTDVKLFTDNIFERFETRDNCLIAVLTKRKVASQKALTDNTFSFGTNGLHALIDMYGKADSIICHDELAYVHDINDFVSGLKLFLKPSGVIEIEFNHLVPILEGKPLKVTNSECFSYFSLTTVDKILKKHGLVIFDVIDNPADESLTISVRHAEEITKHISNRVTTLRGKERSMGMSSLNFYTSVKNKLANSLPDEEELSFLSGHSKEIQ